MESIEGKLPSLYTRMKIFEQDHDQFEMFLFIFLCFFLYFLFIQPMELESAKERESIMKKKYEAKRFFEDMEANIIKKVNYY